MAAHRPPLVLPHPLFFLLLTALAALLIGAWWWPNRPVAGDVPMPQARFNSVSFAPFRADQSPLSGRFASAAQVDQDLALMATRTRAIRTYAAIEGKYDVPAMARAHGLKMWQGIWLGSDRAANAREIAAGIAAANRYPDVIERVVVGNEVLLRKDLPVDELIVAIDQVKHAVRQTVTYADVWNFFVDNPQVVPHLDVLTIHILPYWEDVPTNIDGAIAHVATVTDAMQARFPAKPVAIGETGWPSRGRWRRDAAPSLVNQVVFLRRFMALAQQRRLDYNFIESFDQVWKYRNEGVIGASWGLWTADRVAKFPLVGPVRENAGWPVAAGVSVLCGLVLAGGAVWGQGMTVRRMVEVAVASMALGGGLGFAWAGTAPVLFDRWVVVAAVGNLAGQAALALLFVRHLAGRPALAAPRVVARRGREATDAVRSVMRLRWPAGWTARDWPEVAWQDLAFVFVWAAAVLQLLLLYDPRYRDFPIPVFAVPCLVVVLRVLLTGLPVAGGGREEWVAGGVLALAAVAGAVQEGPANVQSLRWTACALLLAAPPLLRVTPWPQTRRRQ